MTAERLHAQLLAGRRARDPVAVARRLLAIQAQDLRGARLAVRARTRGLTAADVDRALTDDRSLVVTWLNRGTLHLVRSEDYPWLHALTAPRQLTGTRRRLAQEGVSETQAERGVAVIARALATDGPLTRAQLGERVAGAGVPTAGQALVHLLVLASIRGISVRGPVVGGHHAYALVRDWLGEAPAVDREAALAELARRYLAGHAPADDRDLAYWAGIPLRDARAGLAAAGSGCPRRRGRPPEPQPRLLGPYDPVLHGWASRAWMLGRHEPAIVAAGLFRPFLLADGRAAGRWRLVDGRVALEPFVALPPQTAAAVDAERADIERFLA